MKINFNFSFSDIYLLLTVLVPVPVPIPHSFFFPFIDIFFTKPISHVQSQPQFLNQEHTDFRQGSLPRNPPKILVFFLHSTIKLKMQDPAAMFSQMNGNPQFPEQEHLKCPRCDSSNTKFCYYNNYNLSQPRHFCKNCRRYWTKGGVLRNIPVGGGSRKNSKRNSSSTTPAPAPVPVPAGSSSSSSPPHDAQPSEEPYRLMLINAAQPASLNHDRPILDLNGGNFSSLSTPHMGHFGNSTDGPNSDGSNFTDHGQTQSSTHDPGSWNEDPPEVYRPNCWSGSNVWPDNLAMYTPESTSFQQFIEFPSRRTQDS